jgi:hypothetical protein
MTTVVNGFDCGLLQFLYVAIIGNPSFFEVDSVAPILLPASAPLFTGALSLAGRALRRRRTAG